MWLEGGDFPTWRATKRSLLSKDWRESKWKSKDVQQTTTKSNIYASENVLVIIASIQYFFFYLIPQETFHKLKTGLLQR